MTPSAEAAEANRFCFKGSDLGQCGQPFGVAVEDSSGRIYVVDRANHRVNAFDSSGSFLFRFGEDKLTDPTNIAVDNGVANPTYQSVYVVDGRQVLKFDRDGNFLSAFGPVSPLESPIRAGAPIQIEPDGTVDICDSKALGSDNFTVSIAQFDSMGSFQGAVPLESPERACERFAVDAAGNFYLTYVEPSLGVRRYSSTGAAMGAFDPGTSAYSLAVDGANHVFAMQSRIDEPRSIAEWDTSGDIVSRFAYGEILTVLKGMAFQSTTGALVASEETNVVQIFPPPPGPVISRQGLHANPVGATNAGLNVEINPEGAETEFRLEFIDADTCAENETNGGSCFDNAQASAWLPLTSEDFDLILTNTSVGCSDPLNEFPGPCLIPETDYRFRVFAKHSATDAEGNSPVEGTPFKTRPWFEITSTWATEVGSESAQVHAELNPLGLPTTGRFEYVDDASFQSEGGFASPQTQTTGSIDFGSGNSAVEGHALLHGLEPDTVYHYRLAGDNPLIEPVGGPERTLETAGSTSKPPCSNDQVRTGASSYLPDCRAYEMVSPVDKGGADILGAINVLSVRAEFRKAASDGERLTYSSYRAFGDVEGAPYTSQYLARRDSENGWLSRGISPPRGTTILRSSDSLDTEFKTFSEDLCQGWLMHDSDPPLAAGAPLGFANLNAKADLCTEDDGYRVITTVKPPAREPAQFILELQGVSDDGRTAAYLADDALTANAPSVPFDTYLAYASQEGKAPRLICILPGGAPLGTGGCTVGSGGLRRNTRGASVSNAVSDDGSLIYWSKGSTTGPLYLRKNPYGAGAECSNEVAPCTTPVSETVTEAAARYWGAATDGSKAVFTALGGAEAGNLYLYDAAKQESALIAGSTENVLGISEDASRIYFVSEDILTPVANPDGKAAETGKQNLYLYDASEGGTYTFIGLAGAAPGSFVPIGIVSRTTPDGRHLAFMSSEPLTGYDNTDAQGSRALNEIFYYAEGGRLVCVSCNPTGSRPVGRHVEFEGLTVGLWVAAQIPPAENQLYPRRMMSEDGSRVFFESFDSLLARDTNGKMDVYQWQPAQGAADCKARAGRYVASSAGCLSLISTGESRADSTFVDAGKDGRDVFIATAESLLVQDPGQIDIYDARLGGGFPPPPSPVPPCEGEACQSPTGIPDLITPSSTTFRGAGNSKPKRCGKGKRLVKRRGKTRCVAKKQGKSRRRQGESQGRTAR